MDWGVSGTDSLKVCNGGDFLWIDSGAAFQKMKYYFDF